MSIKFTSDRDTLINIIQPAMYASSNKTTLPVLEGLLFSLKENQLSVCGYDQERGIKTSCVVFGMTDGAVVINAQKIFGIIKNFPEGEIQIECNDKNIVRLVGGMSDFSIHGLPAEGFPTLPELSGENNFKISSSLLRDIINSTSYAISQSEARPILMGELFKVEDQSLTVVAADNYRLAMREELSGVSSDNKVLNFVIPGKTLADVAKILNDGESTVNIEFTRKYIIINYNDIIIFSRLLEGEFLDYNRVIPTNGSTFVKINRLDFIESVERSSLIVDEKLKTPLRCKFSGNTLNITCSTQYGKVNDNIRIEMNGNDIEIGFNNRFLLETLRACKDEYVMLTLSSPLMSMTVTPVEKNSASGYLYLVLPMRLKD